MQLLSVHKIVSLIIFKKNWLITERHYILKYFFLIEQKWVISSFRKLKNNNILSKFQSFKFHFLFIFSEQSFIGYILYCQQCYIMLCHLPTLRTLEWHYKLRYVFEAWVEACGKKHQNLCPSTFIIKLYFNWQSF